MDTKAWKQKHIDKIFKSIYSQVHYTELKFTPISQNICSQPLLKPTSLKAVDAQGDFC